MTSVCVCGQEESEGHEHSDDCYTEEKVLICELEENEDHQHSDECYETENENAPQVVHFGEETEEIREVELMTEKAAAEENAAEEFSAGCWTFVGQEDVI